MKKLVILLCFALFLVSKANADGFVDSSGVFTLINTPGPGFQTQALGVNGLGQVVGFDSAGPFLLSNGTLTQLNLPGTPNGINNAGQIVFDGNSGIGFLDTGGHLTPLAFPGAIYSQPTGISNNGLISGVYELPGSSHLQSWVYSNGHFTPFNGPAGSIDTRIWGIDNGGEIVGTSFNGTTITNFIYDDGKFINTGAAALLGVNDLEQVVGTINGQGIVGNADDFDDAKTFNVPGADSTVAKGINNKGEIVGVATFPLPPTNVPEPGTPLLLACGIGLLGIFYRNFRIRES